MNFSILYQSSFLALLAASTFACSGGTLDEGMDATGGATTGTGGVTSTGGAGAAPGSGGGMLVEGCDAEPIIQSSCDGVVCHGSPGVPAQFYTDLMNPPTGQTIGQYLLGQEANYTIVPPASQPDCASPPEQLINPDMAEESLILKKVMGTNSCGAKMDGDPVLTTDQIECIRSWVTAVAANGM